MENSVNLNHHHFEPANVGMPWSVVEYLELCTWKRYVKFTPDDCCSWELSCSHLNAENQLYGHTVPVQPDQLLTLLLLWSRFKGPLWVLSLHLVYNVSSKTDSNELSCQFSKFEQQCCLTLSCGFRIDENVIDWSPLQSRLSYPCKETIAGTSKQLRCLLHDVLLFL